MIMFLLSFSLSLFLFLVDFFFLLPGTNWFFEQLLITINCYKIFIVKYKWCNFSITKLLSSIILGFFLWRHLFTLAVIERERKKNHVCHFELFQKQFHCKLGRKREVMRESNFSRLVNAYKWADEGGRKREKRVTKAKWIDPVLLPWQWSRM